MTAGVGGGAGETDALPDGRFAEVEGGDVEAELLEEGGEGVAECGDQVVSFACAQACDISAEF